MQRFSLGIIGAAAGAVVTALVLTAWPSSLVVAQGQTSGGQNTANMQVTANVVRKCVVSANPLAFGSYDPVQTNASAPLDGQSTIRVSCTKGTAVNIAMDDGTNAQGKVRRMNGPGLTDLTYELYKDSNRTQRWGETFGERYDAGIAPSRDPRDFTVYGRVAASQDVTEGAFQDTILVTVQF